MNNVPIRNAATVILVRDRATNPQVLMGQRGKTAVFMPNKFVFPGGAVDASDDNVVLADHPNEACAKRLADSAIDVTPNGLLAAAIRETWEETGLRMGKRGAPVSWPGFSETGLGPSAAGLRYVFRAITPPGRPRRFDARFFLADAREIDGDLDDFSSAEDELSHLHWVPLTEARALNLPFITEVVLAEVDHLVKIDGPPESVPFFNNSGETSQFSRIF